MAQYKVPQDVEADDKLIGPFSFRQFVYLLIAGGLIAAGIGLFQLMPLLAIVPMLPAGLFLVLALPLKKDQPMETYLAAVVSFYLKPRKRIWTPGQKESTILITAPKIVEDVRTRDISQEEATHRLSFLADIVDTEGFAIKNGANPMRDDLIEEAKSTTDMFDSSNTYSIDKAINQTEIERHSEAIKEMQQAIQEAESVMRLPEEPKIKPVAAKSVEPAVAGPGTVVEPAEPVVVEMTTKKPEVFPSDVIVSPTEPVKAQVEPAKAQAEPVEKQTEPAKVQAEPVEKQAENPAAAAKPDIMELAKNADYSVATIAKEANRIKRKEEGEVFISLH
jgi:hypothetical protein